MHLSTKQDLGKLTVDLNQNVIAVRKFKCRVMMLVEICKLSFV